MNSTGTDLTVALFAGVVPPDGEEPLAEAAGAMLARAGYALRHGGYNGLMEAAARGAARHGVPVTAMLHELTAALYYATTIRSVPVWLLGPTACRLPDSRSGSARTPITPPPIPDL
ncbi:hypothetical protein [Streptomyces scopuliridis]|uniref:SLOG cluster 4 domain-containing protein n=1 Tax=Streptomyces scopuliridis TaxID=452529 RepID=UPI0036948F53